MADRGPPTTRSTEPPRLSGNLGVGRIVFMVVAAAAPLTVLGGNVPLAVANGNGAGAPVGFIVAVVLLLLFSVSFVTMTPYVRRAGAFYAYIERGLGRTTGIGAAYLALITYTAIQVGVWGYMGGIIATTVTNAGGPNLPWWLYTAVVLVLVAFLGYHHIELSARVLGVALVCEIAIVAVFDIVVFGTGGAAGITGVFFSPTTVFHDSPGVAVLFSVTGFLGFESTAVFRDEAKNPHRTVPRATYIAALLIGTFYTISTWAMVEGWGTHKAVTAARNDPDNWMFDVIGSYLGPAGRDVANLLLITSLFACVLSFHNVVSRYQFTLAGRGYFHHAARTVHSRHGSPHVSSLIQSITATVILAAFAIAGLDPLTRIFSFMAGVATVGFVALMLITCVAVVVFFSRRPSSETMLRSRILPAIGSCGLLGALILVVRNFPLVVSGGMSLAVGLGVIPILAFLVGCLAGTRRITRLLPHTDTTLEHHTLVDNENDEVPTGSASPSAHRSR